MKTTCPCCGGGGGGSRICTFCGSLHRSKHFRWPFKSGCHLRTGHWRQPPLPYWLFILDCSMPPLHLSHAASSKSFLAPRSGDGDRSSPFILSFIVFYTVFAKAAGPQKGSLGIIAASATGLIVGAIILAAGPFSGGSMNPARSLAQLWLVVTSDRTGSTGWAHSLEVIFFLAFRAGMSLFFVKEQDCLSILMPVSHRSKSKVDRWSSSAWPASTMWPTEGLIYGLCIRSDEEDTGI
ncbi:hypothetical protein SADUNF_Sadunf03G0051900 [Salix dunnii]|uniref:Uncharacterized protein n=1 Tax=Salix dunnii TaxID=1413687 RepID=A0A835K757_9ROSI|nr:hypothetical protein SADUNF_Sadunf03G0051900 [Salix dunnii]